jgi:hypothetical protein
MPTTSASAGAGCANKVSRRPEAHPAGERIINYFYLTGNYRLQGGNYKRGDFRVIVLTAAA